MLRQQMNNASKAMGRKNGKTESNEPTARALLTSI